MPENKWLYDITVVVPVYNVEEYLIECLDSINNQTKDNIQVIIIDDGSPDKSGIMADEYCKTHPDFECHHIENGGLGHARNVGIALAKGKYIGFIDSDDIIPPNYYEALFAAAERNNSDMATCADIRFNSTEFFESKLHSSAFLSIKEEATHITKNLSLIYDTTSCNKLISMDFINKYNFRFPEKMLYEDIPVIIPMHYLAKNVSVVKSVFYYWRQRDGVTTSITQNVSNMKNLTDRLAVMEMNNEFFKKQNVPEELLRAKLIKDLETDLTIFINNCRLLPDDIASEVLERINAYIDKNISEDILNSAHLNCRQKLSHVRNRDLDALRNHIANQNNYYNSPIIEKDGRFIIDCSDELFSIPDRDVTEDMKKLHPKKNLKVFKLVGSAARFISTLYFPRLNLKEGDQQIEAELFNPVSGAALPLEVIPAESSELTQKRGFFFDEYSQKKSRYNLDGAGFEIIMDTEALPISDDFLGENYININYKNRISEGSVMLGNSLEGTQEKLNGSAILSGDKRISLKFNINGDVAVFVEKAEVLLKNAEIKDDSLFIETDQPSDALYIKNRKTGDLAALEKVEENRFSLPIEAIGQAKAYCLLYERNGETLPLYGQAQSAVFEASKGFIMLSSIKSLEPEIRFLPTLAMLRNIKIDEAEPNLFKLRTTLFAKESSIKGLASAELGFIDTITRNFKRLKLKKPEIESSETSITFAINLENEKLLKNLHDALVPLLIKLSFKDESETMVPLFAEKAINKKLDIEDLKIRFFNFDKNIASFKVWPVWSDEQNTPSKRKALINENYEKFLKEEINPKRIIFESMWGEKYDCNPRALYEYIDKNYPEYECIWAFADPHRPIKGRGKRVRYGSLEYYHYLATAKYLVNNVNFPAAYIKREGQIELQTMHGTPLKTFGLEVPGELPTEQARQAYIDRNKRWNYLTVQGEFMKSKVMDCFGTPVKTLKLGYPRTDVLYKATDEKIAALKENLGIPEGKKVVLYAPTWRIRNKFDMQLDIERFKRELGDTHVLLIRIHHFSAAGYKIPEDNEVIFDMNRYPSIEELYIVSDALITDYSSALFDYAVTGKPMIFFLHDIEDYKGNLRGTYFDVEKEAPGALAYTNDELFEALKDPEKAAAESESRRKAFMKKYLTYERGNSCKRVLRRMIKNIDSIPARLRRKKLVKQLKAEK